MLYSAEDNLLIAGDQILAKISPNVSVEAMEPDGDPLGVYLRSLERMKARLPEDALVLPGHNLPFVGLHTRADELIAHHEARCAAIVEACSFGAADGGRARAGHLRAPDRRSAPARLRLRRGARPRQHDDPRRPPADRQRGERPGVGGGVMRGRRRVDSRGSNVCGHCDRAGSATGAKGFFVHAVPVRDSSHALDRRVWYTRLQPTERHDETIAPALTAARRGVVLSKRRGSRSEAAWQALAW